MKDEIETEKLKVCSICGRDFIGWGNNAEPINDGICCDDCNGIVIGRRLLEYQRRRKSDDEKKR